MTQQANKMATDEILSAERVAPGSNASVEPSVASVPAGNVEIISVEERNLEIRDNAGHCWVMPIGLAADLVHWWVDQGRTQTPWGVFAPQQRFGRVWVSLPSDRRVYVRGTELSGRPKATGFLFPRAVVEALVLTVLLRDKKEPQVSP